MSQQEIYGKILSRCPEGGTLVTDRCYKALMVKAYVDILWQEGVPPREILFRVANKFSPDLILDADIKERIIERIRQEALIPKPHLFMESWNYNLGDVAKASGRVGGAFTIQNKGEGVLIIQGLKTSVNFVMVALESGGGTSPYFGPEGSPKGWQQIISAKSSGTIHLVLDLQQPGVALGPFQATFMVFSNDSSHAKSLATVEGNIILGNREKPEEKRQSASEILRNYRSGKQ